ncbi:hypothetical protein GCM10022218_41620 [Sphingobacterium ginsenosidimutans]|uniref:Uncharacterized protein n=1 Tax=Sphingobacterium ginsenosidimutans TaxID=687845 RepID=A0ABP8AFP9_9SPHI
MDESEAVVEIVLGRVGGSLLISSVLCGVFAIYVINMLIIVKVRLKFYLYARLVYRTPSIVTNQLFYIPVLRYGT